MSDMTFSEPLVHELEPRGGSAGVKSSKRMPVTLVRWRTMLLLTSAAIDVFSSNS